MMEGVRKEGGRRKSRECDREQTQRDERVGNTGQETEEMKCPLTLFRF